MQYKKILKPLAIILTLFLIGGIFLVENVLPYSGIKPMRRIPEDLSWLFPKGIAPENYGLKGRELSIQTADGLRLSAMLIGSNTDTTKATVVILHGISACKETNYGRAKLLADAGFASLLLDLRAHGKSDGEFCTFGFYEKQDLRAVADTLARLFPEQPIGIWGASLGGAVALQSMEVEPRYQFGIIESTFDEFYKVAMEYGADWMFGLRSHWLTNRVLHKSGQIAHFEPDAVKPVVSAAKINRPVLFIHGDKDSRIPKWFGERNYEACPSPQKQWVLIPGGGHNNLWNLDGPKLKETVINFVKMNYER